MTGRTYGLTTNADGDLIVRTEPFDWLFGLPVSGDFKGHLVYLLGGGTPGWYYWDGTMWMGPLGVVGGGGGAPANASYLVLGNHAGLSMERVLTAGAAINFVDTGAEGTLTVSVQNFSAASKLLGRGDGAGPFSPQEITLGTNLSMSGTTLNATGGGSTPTGTGFRHVTGGVEDAAARAIDAETADVNSSVSQITGVTNAKLRQSGALSVIGRSLNSIGAPGDILTTAASGAVLREAAGLLGFGQIQAAGVVDGTLTNVKLANMANGTHKARITAGAGAPEDIPMAGAAFPTSPTPITGQRFFRTDHDCLYFRSSAGTWLSVGVYEIEYGFSASITATQFFRLQLAGNSPPLYSVSVGHVFGFDVVVVGMTFRANAAPSAALTIQVVRNNVAVGSASLAISTAASAPKIVTNEAMMSSTITAGGVIAVKNAGSAATTLTLNGKIRFRRIAT